MAWWTIPLWSFMIWQMLKGAPDMARSFGGKPSREGQIALEQMKAAKEQQKAQVEAQKRMVEWLKERETNQQIMGALQRRADEPSLVGQAGMQMMASGSQPMGMPQLPFSPSSALGMR